MAALAAAAPPALPARLAFATRIQRTVNAEFVSGIFATRTKSTESSIEFR
jgi:hypothetical protein